MLFTLMRQQIVNQDLKSAATTRASLATVKLSLPALNRIFCTRNNDATTILTWLALICPVKVAAGVWSASRNKGPTNAMAIL